MLYVYTKILEVNVFALAYRLFHEDFSTIDGALSLRNPIMCRYFFMHSVFNSYTFLHTLYVHLIVLFTISSS